MGCLSRRICLKRAGLPKYMVPAKQQDAALSFKSRHDVEFERRQKPLYNEAIQFS